jgi:hypothetical protein
MNGVVPRLLPRFNEFCRWSREKQTRCLHDSLGAFLDSLQVEGREARMTEAQQFQRALDALREGDSEQAFEYAQALQRHAAAMETNGAIPGQFMSRAALASGLRGLIEEAHSQTIKPESPNAAQ